MGTRPSLSFFSQLWGANPNRVVGLESGTFPDSPPSALLRFLVTAQLSCNRFSRQASEEPPAPRLCLSLQSLVRAGQTGEEQLRESLRASLSMSRRAGEAEGTARATHRPVGRSALAVAAGARLDCLTSVAYGPGPLVARGRSSTLRYAVVMSFCVFHSPSWAAGGLANSFFFSLSFSLCPPSPVAGVDPDCSRPRELHGARIAGLMHGPEPALDAQSCVARGSVTARNGGRADGRIAFGPRLNWIALGCPRACVPPRHQRQLRLRSGMARFSCTRRFSLVEQPGDRRAD